MSLHFTEADILESGVDEIIGAESLRSQLISGKKLKIKFGIDPTSPNIHLGRSIPLWKLRAFQELGHEIHLIVGDFTGEIGDTSDKEAERPMLTKETIQTNLSHYLEQIWMILNPAKKELVTVHYNSEWLEVLTLSTLGKLADAFSVNQFIKRDLIGRRLEAGSRISLREMLYPLMQGYDSVMLESDVELGGTDQRFNMLAGRILQEQEGQIPQAVIMNTLINGTDGRKMSSSWGNVISLRDTPQDKFGKLMSSKDEVMASYLLVVPISVRPFSETELHKRLEAGENPRDLKLMLAEHIVALYHGEEIAEKTKEAFIAQFTEGNKPEDIMEISWSTLSNTDQQTLVEILVATDLAPSKSEGRRLIEQGGVRTNEEVVSDVNQQVYSSAIPLLIQVGKRRFVRIIK